MRKRRKKWLQVKVFMSCERAEPAPNSQTGPWTLHSVWHNHQISAPFAFLPGAEPFTPLTLFVQLISRLKRVSQPREIKAHLFSQDGQRFVCSYRFPTQSFRPGTMVYIARPLESPPVTEAGWYEFLLVLDDPKRTVLARSEVYLTP